MFINHTINSIFITFGFFHYFQNAGPDFNHNVHCRPNLAEMSKIIICWSLLTLFLESSIFSAAWAVSK